MFRWPQLCYKLSTKDADFTALSTSKNLNGLHHSKRHLKSLLAEELTHRTNLPQLLATGLSSLLAVTQVNLQIKGSMQSNNFTGFLQSGEISMVDRWYFLKVFYSKPNFKNC